MTEEWRDINGYEGLYQVSNLGRVRRIHKDPRSYTYRYLIPSCNNNSNYYRVRLSKSNQIKAHTIHRLVATAFVSNPDNKPQVNHIDGNKHNNAANNLEWCTAKENVNHAYCAGLHNTERTRKGYAALCIPVCQYNKAGDFIREFTSLTEAAKACSANKHAGTPICRCAKGKVKSAYGYVWRYAEALVL